MENKSKKELYDELIAKNGKNMLDHPLSNGVLPTIDDFVIVDVYGDYVNNLGFLLYKKLKCRSIYNDVDEILKNKHLHCDFVLLKDIITRDNNGNIIEIQNDPLRVDDLIGDKLNDDDSIFIKEHVVIALGVGADIKNQAPN